MSNAQQSEHQTQPDGVFYVGRLVAVKVSERDGYQNGDIVLIRDGSTDTDKLAFKPGSEVHDAASLIPLGSQVVAQVIPARRAVSKAGKVYVRAPYVVAVEQSA